MRCSGIPVVVLAAMFLSACDSDDPITGPGSKAAVSLDFCTGSIPVWFVIQNESEAWEEIPVASSGTFSFEATPRFSIAYVTTVGSDIATRILNVARDDLAELSGANCQDLSGTKPLSGSVTGLTGPQVVRLSMARAVAAASATNPGYTLTGLPAGPLDLVATRFATSATQPSDRVIVRRNLDLQSGATIPVLDFGGSEAQPMATAIVTFASRGNDLVDLVTEFLTANGTRHQLMQLTSLSSASAAFVSVPAALRGSDDLHRLTTVASAATGTRDVVQYYRNPSDRTITFGPQLSTPASTVASTSPYVRPRLTVASQPEYPAAMQAFFGQLTAGTFRSVTILTTAGFLGGRPATWELEMPDLSAAGYNTTWAFPNGTNINANARGFDGEISVFLGAEPSDGDVITSAVRSAS